MFDQASFGQNRDASEDKNFNATFELEVSPSSVDSVG